MSGELYTLILSASCAFDPDRFQYISIFLDDHSMYNFIGLMKHRSDIFDVFKGVQARFWKAGGALAKKLHTNGAGEYIALQNALEGGDANKSISPPYTLELNGIAERVHHTMVETALSMRIQAELPSSLWLYTVKHAIYVCNRVQHLTSYATPYSLFTETAPFVKHIRVFGCKAYL